MHRPGTDSKGDVTMIFEMLSLSQKHSASGKMAFAMPSTGSMTSSHPICEYLRRLQEDPASRVFVPVVEYYRRAGRLDEALDICREGLEHNPDYQVGRVALAKCYLDKKWFTEARAELERVVGVVPESLLGQRLRGDACLALRDRAAALHAYKMAMLLSPSDVGLAEKVHSLETDTLGRAPAEAPDVAEEEEKEQPEEVEEMRGVVPSLLHSKRAEPSLNRFGNG